MRQLWRRYVRTVLAGTLAGLVMLGALAPMPAQTSYAQSGDDVISEVNGEPITRAEFEARVRFVRWQYLNEMVKIYELTGGSLELAGDYLRGHLQDLNDPESFGDVVLHKMEEDRLVWQASEDLGQAITAEDAADREARFFSAWTDVDQASLATDATAQAFITQWFAEASEVSGLSEDDLHDIFATEALRDVMLDVIGENVPTEELAVDTRHILCAFTPASPAAVTDPTPEQRAAAQACIAEALTWLDRGEDFATTAMALSNDTASAADGGNLGLVPLSYLTQSYADAVTDAELNTLIGPVETEYGLHLIEVLDRQMQPLTDEQIEDSKYGYFETWLDSLWTDATVTRSDAWNASIPTVPGFDTLPEDVRTAVEALSAAQ
ncbi:MAG TPA: peptidylprolyl isomerase [Aggregatilinea sp.]|uniref:peptidylprolyl isomerase n=1 Tax=Aggregatilinea sp. TaxID=2806333 RepID=UPI002C7FF73E|nr:peptidylprolyl isomerase [Aggregatilinea sp.]HML24491.1 peptidylprolyl isomerase [Aggregatilinea sp.]